MSIRKYIAYLRTVETGSITRAAERLGYSQPGLTGMLNRLEQEIGYPVLVRPSYVLGGRAMQIVSGEVRRLSRLVRNMLDIAKLQAMGVEDSRKTRFDLGEELSDVLITFEQKIYNKHLDVRVDLPDKPVWTRAERDSITQVIYNLIDNAIKFCPDGGRLSLRVQSDGGPCVGRKYWPHH